MKQKKSPRIIRIRHPPHRGKCPECDTEMEWKESATWECPKCRTTVKRIPHYSKYPDMKHDAHGAYVPAKYYRVNPKIRFLKPIKRVTRTKGKEYVHYVISTTIPEEWKDGVKVTIEPVSSESSVEKERQNERDMNEMGPLVRSLVEEHLKRMEREANRDEQWYYEWLFTHGSGTTHSRSSG